jgi:hypothetical protein
MLIASVASARWLNASWIVAGLLAGVGIDLLRQEPERRAVAEVDNRPDVIEVSL